MYSSLASIGCKTSLRTPKQESGDGASPFEEFWRPFNLLLALVALRILIIVLTPENALWKMVPKVALWWAVGRGGEISQAVTSLFACNYLPTHTEGAAKSRATR